MQATITCFFFVIVCILLFEPTVLGVQKSSEESSEEMQIEINPYAMYDCDVKDGSRLYSQDKFIRNLTTTEIEEARVFEEEAKASFKNFFKQLEAGPTVDYSAEDYSAENYSAEDYSAEDYSADYYSAEDYSAEDYPTDDYPPKPAFCNGLGADKNVADSPPPIDGQ